MTTTPLYWLKLYYEILDDPKVMLLSPELRWRFIEALLVAGRAGEDGDLPPISTIAFWVRDTPETLYEDYKKLTEKRLLEPIGPEGIVEGWPDLADIESSKLFRVRKFKDRQATLSKAEYMRRKRERDRDGVTAYAGDSNKSSYRSGYSNVTGSNIEERRKEKRRVKKRVDPYPEEIEEAAALFFSLFPDMPTPIDTRF